VQVEHLATSNSILLLSQLRRLGADERRVRHAVARGELVRVHRGAYLPAGEWTSLDEREQYRLRVLAAGLSSRGGPVLSHHSAAAMLGVPTIGHPSLIHVLTTLSSGSRTENGFRRHATTIDDEDVIEHDGVRLTSLRRTLIDLARETPFASSVAALDWSLRPPRRGEPPRMLIADLQAYFDTVSGPYRRRRVHRALEFATPLAETPGESLSRVVIHELGFPAPRLQYEVHDARGLAGITDFAWPEYGLLGEFDGLVKYTRALARPGENVEDIVVREKIREDRLRATERGMVRWLWRDALRPELLERKLLDAGLPHLRRKPPR
jgi:hypothetical protein